MSKSSKDYEKAISGNEPVWNLKSNISLTRALNWYNYFSDVKDSKKYTIHYLKNTSISKQELSDIESLPDYHFSTIGFVCRMKDRGAPLTPRNLAWIEEKILELKSLTKEEVKEDKKTQVVVSIQERLSDRTSQFIGEMEGAIDECIETKTFTFDAYDWMVKNQVKGAHARIISNFFDKRLSELNDAISGEDEQLVEGYSNFKKTELKKYALMISKVVDDCDRIIHNTKLTRAPRKTKAKPVEKIISKVQYKKEDNAYKIASINPTDIIGASQLWIFNTKTRKLGIYNATDRGGLNIKGTTLTNYDEESSVQKTIRKPEVILPNVINSGKVALKKIMPAINAVEQKLTGRLNSDTILLRVIK